MSDENKSAMERLRESIRFFDESFGQTPAQLAHAARAALAEHDAAQALPPSEALLNWRQRMANAIIEHRREVLNGCDACESWDKLIRPLLDEAEASAAPAPDNTPINDWMVKVANLSLELQRANAIIDALLVSLRRKP